MPIDPDTLAARLRAATNREVALEVLKTSSTIVQRLPGDRGSVRVRVHEIFFDAPEPVLDALVAWARRPTRRSNAALDDYAIRRADALRACARTTPARARGRHVDLRRIFDSLNVEHFDGRLRCVVTFGRVAPRRRLRSLQYGAYDPLHDRIRIHPVLDLDWIAPEFVELIVFHEMLHAAIPARRDDATCRHHPPEFRARERRFPRYAAARAWEKRNLRRLLREAGAAPAPPRVATESIAPPRQLSLRFPG